VTPPSRRSSGGATSVTHPVVAPAEDIEPAAEPHAAPRRARIRSASSSTFRRRAQTGFLFALPAMVAVTGIMLIPLFQAAYYSLTTWNGLTSTYIGFSSYTQLFFHTVGIGQILENNAWVVISIPVGLALALVAAFLTATRAVGWKLFRSVVFFPVALSWVVIGIVFGAFLAQDGGLNALLRASGLGHLTLDWLGSPATALPALLVTFAWAMFGINTVIFISGLATIPPDLFDAARVDGAGTFRVLLHVVLPLMRRFVALAFVVTLISGFTGIFGLIYVMTSGGPGFSTTTLEFQVYQEAFSLGNFGTAAALGMVLFAMMAVVTAVVGVISGRSSNI
jgi:ABC-type sugar transport system permease subunit